MIILDTHVWIWHVQGDKRLTADYEAVIQQYESIGLGVNAISLWEIAKAVEHGGFSFPIPLIDNYSPQSVRFRVFKQFLK